MPCYRTDEGILLTIPLPADEEAGTFTLTVDRPVGRIVRQITIDDHDFGRELIFLPDSIYRRATSTREIARDARAVKTILSVESPERRWSGRWREPVRGMKSTGYGVERYYYRATDSTRSITLDTQAKTRGTFGGDTSDAPPAGAPSWRHAGVDIPAKRGASIIAPAAGVVIDVGEYVLSGRTVLVDHGQGVVSAYFHLDTATVSKGDNSDELGALINFGVELPQCSSIVIQPMAHTGDGGDGYHANPAGHRLTMPEVHELIESGTGWLKKEHFHPVPCSHPSCYTATYLFRMNDGRYVPLPDFVDVRQYLDAMANRAIIRTDAGMERLILDAITNLWSATKVGEDSDVILASLKTFLKDTFNSRNPLSAAEIDHLPLRSPGGAIASQLGFVALALAIASTWWVDQSRITIVSGGPYLLVLTAAYLWMRRSRPATAATP
jgi:hypothetical protein